MKVLIAPDSFKECLSAPEVARAIAEGWRRVAPQDVLVEMPLADGGEGTTVALVNAAGGTLHPCTVTGPLGAVVTAYFGLLADGSTAVVEVAEASGLHLVAPDQRDALRASSFGTGELILAALQHQPRRLIIGLGGSATTDAGVGLLQALGARFKDALGKALSPGGGALINLVHIDIAAVVARLSGVEVLVATDVTNVLLGPRGAAAVFAPQKGASADQVLALESGLQHYAACARAHGYDVDSVPGSGAAGGIGGTLFGMFGAGKPGAQIVSGVELVMRTVGLEQQLRDVDIVITGEGSLDAQSAAGKVPAGVCALAQRHGVPVIALAGVVGESVQTLHGQALHERGLTAAFSIAPGPLSRAEALASAAQNLARTAEQIARLLHAMR
ncbi:MAG: glycerate kinase [Gammaproteobacteria bacterium]|nr:glycerate kinase [Gammaproteobacteria bacterium]